MKLMKRLKQDDHGLATLEMAIVFPLLLLLLFVITEGGLFIFTKHQLERASREGARAYAMDVSEKLSDTALKAMVSLHGTSHLTGESVKQCITAGNPKLVSVTLTATFASVSASTLMVPEWIPPNSTC
jgi:Flp pilus assembly protein TadG